MSSHDARNTKWWRVELAVSAALVIFFAALALLPNLVA